MKRKRNLVIMAHCLLNVNAKVEGIAAYPAASRIVSELIGMDYGIIQLPCIEQAMFGIRRWGIVHDQCDFPAFRKRCRELLDPIVDQIEDFISSDYEVAAIIGIDGSPTCGVNIRAAGDWYGEVGYKYGLDAKINSVFMETGMGTMMEVLKEMLNEKGIDIPFLAIDENSDNISARQILEGTKA